MSISVKSHVPQVRDALQDRKRDALNATGITISGEAKSMSPVDKGRLRSSIAWVIDGGQPQYPPATPGDELDGRELNANVRAPKDTVLIGTNVVYARYQHEGVSPSGAPLNYQMPTAESKFLEKAARRNQDKVKRDIRRALEGKLEKE